MASWVGDISCPSIKKLGGMLPEIALKSARNRRRLSGTKLLLWLVFMMDETKIDSPKNYRFKIEGILDYSRGRSSCTQDILLRWEVIWFG